MKLIREEIEQVEVIVENRNGKKNLFIEGVFLQGEIKNRNGRMYPMETLRKEVSRYNENHIQSGRALGELDHPESSVVNLNNASHNVIEMHWDGDDLLGTVEVLSTPSGNILKELFKSGIKLGISSRGLGSVEPVNEKNGEDGTVEVQPDFELIAFDFVSNPSTHGAFLSPTNEGKLNEGVGTRDGVCCHDCKIENIINDIFRGE